MSCHGRCDQEAESTLGGWCGFRRPIILFGHKVSWASMSQPSSEAVSKHQSGYNFFASDLTSGLSASEATSIITHLLAYRVRFKTCGTTFSMSSEGF
jgi:hypothetical protein